MPKRLLPASAAAALDIIVGTGGCEIRANDLDLRMHQSGFDSRAVRAALKTFERRGWLVAAGNLIKISEEALIAKPSAGRNRPASKRKYAHMSRGLFGK